MAGVEKDRYYPSHRDNQKSLVFPPKAVKKKGAFQEILEEYFETLVVSAK